MLRIGPGPGESSGLTGCDDRQTAGPRPIAFADVAVSDLGDGGPSWHGVPLRPLPKQTPGTRSRTKPPCPSPCHTP